MRDQQSSRSQQLLRVGQVGVKSLLKEPVKEAVREALAEEQSLAETRAEHTRRSDEREQAENRDESESGNRILRPAVLLPVLGLAVMVAVVKRQRLLEFVDGKGVVDGSDQTDAAPGTNQQTTTTSDSTGTGVSTSRGTHGGNTTRDESVDNGDYNLDSDTEGLSKTE